MAKIKVKSSLKVPLWLDLKEEVKNEAKSYNIKLYIRKEERLLIHRIYHLELFGDRKRIQSFLAAYRKYISILAD